MNPAHIFEACRRPLVIPIVVGITLMAAGAGAAPAIAASGSVLSGVSCSAANACTGVRDYVRSGTSVKLSPLAVAPLTGEGLTGAGKSTGGSTSGNCSNRLSESGSMGFSVSGTAAGPYPGAFSASILQ